MITDNKLQYSSKFKLKTIQCPNCGGSVALYGGQKVETVVCQYCSWLLDTKDNFKPIAPVKMCPQNRRKIPIGTEGTLNGVDYVVIGIAEYKECCENIYSSYNWTEHLLYSYTHGYAWLCLENNQWTLLHETKETPRNLPYVFPQERYLEPPISIFVGNFFSGKNFIVYEHSHCMLDYVEGEMTWQAKIGDISEYIDAIAPPYIYSIERHVSEMEFFCGEYIKHTEISKAFGIRTLQPSHFSIGACQPSNPILKAIGIAALLACFLSWFLLNKIQKTGHIFKQFTVPESSFSSYLSEPIHFYSNGAYSLSIEIPELINSWTYYEIYLLDEENIEHLKFSREISYYCNTSKNEEWWREGQRIETFYFNILPGTYTIDINAEGNSGETASPDPSFKIKTTFTLKNNLNRSFFLSIICPIFFLIFLIYVFYELGFEIMRWRYVVDDND